MLDTRLLLGDDNSLNDLSIPQNTHNIIRDDPAVQKELKTVPMPILTPRNFTLFTAISLGSVMIIKSRSLAEQRRENVAGDYSVKVERSGGGI